MTLPHVVQTFEPHWLENQSSEKYHADKTAVSSSSLRKILKSPATFHSYVTDAVYEETIAMRFGSMFHMALLEPKKFFSQYIEQPEFGDLRSTANRKKRDEWKASLPPDVIVLTNEELIRMEGMVNSVLRHQDASALLKHGQPEVSGFYRDPETGIKCKIKPDFLNLDMMTLVDIKTTTDCSQHEFSKTIWKYRYDIQSKMYCEGIKEITGKSVNYSIWIVIEKDPPYECAVWLADETIAMKGLEGYRTALNTLYDCLRTNEWKGCQNKLEPIGLPNWVLSK